MLSIQRTLIISGGRVVFAEPKTATGRRTVPVPPETGRGPKAHHKALLEDRIAYGEGYEESGLVFRATPALQAGVAVRCSSGAAR